MIDVDNLPRLRELIIKLNNMAETRKALFDQFWIIEHAAEEARLELMKLLNHP